MKTNTPRQYTIRNIPDAVDRVLRRRAQATGKSFNQVAIEALSAGADTSLSRRDLSFLVGSMDHEEAKRMESEVALQRRVDPDLWK